MEDRLWRQAQDACAVAAQARKDAQRLRGQALGTRSALMETRLHAMHMLADWQDDPLVNEPV